MERFAVLVIFCFTAPAKSPAPLPDGVERRADVLYATYGSRQMQMDLYLPRRGQGPSVAIKSPSKTT